MKKAIFILALLFPLILLAATRVQMLIYREPGFQGDWGGGVELTLLASNASGQKLVDYQLRFELPSNLIGVPFRILDSQGRELPYCFEQPSGECGAEPSGAPSTVRSSHGTTPR